MARMRKWCRVCAGWQPCRLTLGPGAAAGTACYTATCTTCETVHPPDSTTLVADGRAWASKIRAQHGSLLQRDGTLRST